MKITFKNDRLEFFVFLLNCLVGFIVAASFVIMLGFEQVLLDLKVVYIIQIVSFTWFVLEKIIRFLNSVRKKEYLKTIWFELPLLIFLIIVVLTANRYSMYFEPYKTRIVAVWLYLVFQVVDKLARSIVSIAATGKNPTITLIASFVITSLIGSGLLMLPKTYETQSMSYIDALFTATSATCVTGLIVKDTGTDFSLPGQFIILTLIQLGGLGIMVFGAVFALLLRQAISVSESVALQDVLSSETLGKIGTMIGFIFTFTVIVETIGAILMHGMWDNAQSNMLPIDRHQVFSSIFHSISAFCNAGFSLNTKSLIEYSSTWQVFGVFCPLIILGGLGFGVLYDLVLVTWQKIKFYYFKIVNPSEVMRSLPKRLTLQSKIVLTVSLILIITGATSLLLFEKVKGNADFTIGEAFFQSVTARTAGFNTVDIGAMTSPGKLLLIILMFIGGSPGSTAGGIKTVTLCVVLMAAWATIRKRNEVEIFKRSIRYVIIGRAITVVIVFVLILLSVTMLLTITERNNDFTMEQILFESASALGTVGLSTGITPELSTLGKLIIIITMLIGRLGPLTLLAGLTFNIKPYRYSYPDETLIVG